MNLRGRLDALRRAGGGIPAAAGPEIVAGSPAERLLQRIERLRGRNELRDPPCDSTELAERLGAEPVGDGLLRIEREQDWDPGEHGPAGGDPWPLPARAEPQRLWFFDTETNGLAGGTGTIAFLVGWAVPRGGRLRISQYLLTGFAGETLLLEQLAAATDADTMLVSYNGKRFDAPLLATRFRLHGMADALAGRAHADLLYPVRRMFSAHWPDCRLVTAEQRLLGADRVGDLPGSEAPMAWMAWLRRRDPRGLLGVVEHNRRDLVSLAGLWRKLCQVYADPPAFGADLSACARLYLERGHAGAAFELLRANRHRLDADGLRMLADACRRNNDWAQAVDIWQLLSRSGCQHSVAALARFHEHQARDPDRAMGYACQIVDPADRQKRILRLRRKLERLAPA